MAIPNRRIRYSQIISKWPKLFSNPQNARYEILVDPELVSQAEFAERGRLEARELPGAWSFTGVVYEDPWMMVVRDAVRRPDGTLGTYARTLPASGAAGAAVLPLLDGQIVLVRHFRHATRTWHLEIPRGYGEEGVSAAEQARQELREEIQAEVGELIHLGAFHTNTGNTGDQVELFLAEILALGSPQSSEGIDAIEIFTPYQVAQMIRADEDSDPLAITDSFTIGAFTRAWLSGRLPGLPLPTLP